MSNQTYCASSQLLLTLIETNLSQMKHLLVSPSTIKKVKDQVTNCRPMKTERVRLITEALLFQSFLQS